MVRDLCERCLGKLGMKPPKRDHCYRGLCHKVGYFGCSRGDRWGSCRGDIDIGMEVDVDMVSSIGCLNRVSKSVPVPFQFWY